MKYLTIHLFSFFLLGLTSLGQSNTQKIFKSKYCFESKEHSLTVSFKIKGDTIFLYYLDISGNGNYLNGFDEDNDYAGKFAKRKLLIIKSTFQ